MSSFPVKILEKQVEIRDWEEIERALLELCDFDDSMKVMKKDLMDVIESPWKGVASPQC